MNRLGLVALWLAATVAVTVVAFEVVGAAESQVAERPLTPVVAIDDSVPEDDPGPTTTVTTMTDPTAPSTSPESTTTTSPPGSSPSTSSTTTTLPGTVPTTTGEGTDDTGWATLNVPTAAGTVTVEHRPGEVRLLAVTARSGFSVGATELGPPKVRVDFDSAALRVRVEVEWDDGGPEVDVKEHTPEDDHD